MFIALITAEAKQKSFKQDHYYLLFLMHYLCFKKPMDNTDWDKLRLFHTVAEAGSLTHAGKTLGLTQSSVSRQISSLEKSLGVQLFRRHARGLVLSEQGEMLHETTKEIYQKLSGIKGVLVDTHRKPQGPLTVLAPELIGSTLIAPRLYRFREQYPDIQLTVIFEERIINLNTKKADISIRLKKPKEADHIQRKLSTIDFHVCASNAYIEKYGMPQTVDDLKDHCLITFPDGLAGPIGQGQWLLDMAKIDPDKHSNIIFMNSMYAIYRAAQKDAGIAILPDYMIHYAQNMTTIPLKVKEPSVDLYFVYADERRHSKRIQAFRDFLIDNIKDTPLALS